MPVSPRDARDVALCTRHVLTKTKIKARVNVRIRTRKRIRKNIRITTRTRTGTRTKTRTWILRTRNREGGATAEGGRAPVRDRVGTNGGHPCVGSVEGERYRLHSNKNHYVIGTVKVLPIVQQSPIHLEVGVPFDEVGDLITISVVNLHQTTTKTDTEKIEIHGMAKGGEETYKLNLSKKKKFP